MMFRSIRSRLALSFAGIALVAALALGAVLLAILQNYYSNLELNYMRENAQAIEDVVAKMRYKNMPRDVMQKQIQGLAFITQTRIQLFDTDNTLLYDSGSPQNISIDLSAIKPSLETKGDPSSNSPDGPQLSTSSGPDPSVPVPEDTITVYSSGRTDSTEVVPAYAFALRTEGITGGARSKLAVAMPLHDPENGSALGSIRLSEGPAYGRAILENVASGWGVASALAVLLAAGIGGYISRRISAPVLALMDVTGRMAQGDLSSRAVAQGQDEIGQLALSFNEMADRVEATITTLRRFVSDAAHELRTPLTTLRANLFLARDEKYASERAMLISRAQATVERLEELNTNLLDLSRLEANGSDTRGTVVDLTELLHERSEVYASEAEQAGLIFEQDLPSAPVFIHADVNEIVRAIDNLVDNACKFTPQGGTVRVALSQQDRQAIISIADTGIGIPEDELPQLFNRFHRGRNAAMFLGSGLGLALVKAIVTAHKGNAEVQSAGEGKGSKFSITLPSISEKNY